VAVSLGYNNVYRYPEGYPQWQQRGLPVSSVDFLSRPTSGTSSGSVAVPTGLHLLLILGGVFLGGIALNLTPCIYPLIPITVSYFGGRSGSGKGKTLIHGISYILGLATTNSVLGVIAALTGGLLGALLQNSFILIGIAAVLVLFASSLFGLWEIRLPTMLTGAASSTYSGYGGSLFMGLTLGIVAAPCIGPFVIGLFTWIAAIGQMWFGFMVFFILSLGMGLPLFFLAVFSGRIEQLPRSGEWLLWVKKLMGWVLLAMSAYFIRPLVSEALITAIYSAIALGAGFHLGWFEKSSSLSPGFKKLRITLGIACIGIALFITATYLNRGPGVSWDTYNNSILEQAREQGKPVIIDFYAAWCAPCRELDISTFRDEEVVNRSHQFIMLKIDLTTGANPAYEELIDTFDVKGVPTVIFINSKGEEKSDIRMIDYSSPTDFLSRMAALN
jgi:thiol:disulfide interchange protein DsbD